MSGTLFKVAPVTLQGSRQRERCGQDTQQQSAKGPGQKGGAEGAVAQVPVLQAEPQVRSTVPFYHSTAAHTLQAIWHKPIKLCTYW